jgi:hypothetical protein
MTHIFFKIKMGVSDFRGKISQKAIEISKSLKFRGVTG